MFSAAKCVVKIVSLWLQNVTIVFQRRCAISCKLVDLCEQFIREYDDNCEKKSSELYDADENDGQTPKNDSFILTYQVVLFNAK